MTIKAKAVGKALSEGEFPRLMINKAGMVVLFRCAGTGMVVSPESGNSARSGYGTVGYYSATWDMDKFEPWIGVVTIEQD